jgi:hypothetical protein
LKRITIFFFAAFIFVIVMVAPVMACPTRNSQCWRMTPASDNYQVVTYDQLTTMCLSAGLSKNPYPAPSIPTVTGPDENGILHLNGASEYYTFTITIGDRIYQGISCTTYDMTLNVVTGVGDIVYSTRHFFGELGNLNHGFNGVCSVHLFADSHYTAIWVLHGFGCFTGQTLMLWQNSKESAIATGYCLTLGNKRY